MTTETQKLPESWQRLVDKDQPQPPTAVPVKSLVSKLAEVMAAVQRIAKRGKNDFHGYHYATEADIAETIRMELASRSVMLIPAVLSEQRIAVGEKGSVLTVLEMEMEFLDGENGQSIKKPWRGYGSDKDDKGGYKAMTGAEKYFLLKTFLIPTGDDPERDDRKARERQEKQTVRSDAPENRPPHVPVRAGAKCPAIPEGCLWLAEVAAGTWGKAKGQALAIDDAGVEHTYAMFDERLVTMAQQLCADGQPVRADFGQPKAGGKSYIKALHRLESDHSAPLSAGDIPF